MKNLILSVAILFSFTTLGQVKILDFNPKNPCPGDSLSVTFSYSAPVAFQFNVFTATINAIFSTLYPGGDSAIIKFKLQPFLSIGQATISTGPAISAQSRTLFLCDAVGILELESNNTKELVYFDLQGNRIEKRTNELIFEQVGHKRRKIYIEQ